MSERVELTLSNLKDLDQGKVPIMFGLELKKALQDCLNRPSLKKARKVTLELEITPVANEGECEKVLIGFDVKSRIPPRRTEAVPLGITHAGQAWFYNEEPEDLEATR